MFTQEDVLSMVKGAEINQLSRCQELVRTHGPGIITALAKTGWQKGSSALHFAAMGSLPVLQWFLEQEIDFNAIDSDGSTALMWAVYVGPKDPVQVLLARGANARLQDAQGLTALDYARREGKADVVAILEGAYSLRESISFSSSFPSFRFLVEHEQYLSQIGSHTKAAMREPAHPVAELQADQVRQRQADEPAVNLLDVQQSLPSSDDSCFPDPKETAGSEECALRKVGLAETHGVLAAGTPQLQTQTMPALDLGGLDFDLPE
eukprot:m.244592 g.244592  ORF g.244592 m.244592 type:complete len:264 (+) comp54465_c0_seq8:136-927(+)